jgi:hypothetical protein
MMPIRLLVALIAGFLFFCCGRKKKAAPNISDWLELHFPNRFDVVETQISDPIRNLSFKVKTSIVAEKADPLSQIEIKWDKRKPDLGITATAIDSLFETSRRELADARDLLALLRNAGFEKSAASIRNGDATVLLFENPSAENRKRALNALKTAFSGWPAAPNYGLWISFMEPASFQAEFTDIVPLTHWLRPDRWQSSKTVVYLGVAAGYEFDVRKLGEEWLFNTESERAGQWVEQAWPVAEQWAATHFQKKVVLEPQTEFYPWGDTLGMRMKIPFKFAENEPRAGYISVDFLLDGEVFKNLKVVDY